MEYYFITYKKITRELPEVYEYYVILDELKTKFNNLVHYWETDSTGRLHLHCIGEARKNIYLRQFSRKNYTFKIEPVYDMERLRQYLHKQCKNSIEQEQLLDSLYFKHYYGFSEPPVKITELFSETTLRL